VDDQGSRLCSSAFDKSLNPEQLNLSHTALMTWRQAEAENTYRFSLKQNGGMSQGSLKIDLCSADENRGPDADCDGWYSIHLLNNPKPFDNGRQFLLGEIDEIVSGKPRQQVVLQMAIIHPE
jgi:hypothetical protein